MTVAAVTMVMMTMVAGGPVAPAAAGNRPRFCELVREAYQSLSEVEGSESEAYRHAVDSLRAAATSAPEDLAPALREIAMFYEGVAGGDVPLDPSAIQHVLPHTEALGAAVSDDCGFTIDAAVGGTTEDAGDGDGTDVRTSEGSDRNIVPLVAAAATVLAGTGGVVVLVRARGS